MPGRIPSRSLGVFASRSKPIAPRSRVPQALQHSPSTSSRSFSSTSCSYKPLETQGNAAPGPSFTTINADEISHFSRLSSEWWNTKGEFGLLHRMNPPRVEYIRQKLVESERQEDEWSFETRFQDREKESKRGVGKWLAGKRCLDVGCGGGLLSESLARLGGDVIGVDASESNIKIANLHASSDPFLPYTPPIAPVESASSSSSAGSWFSKATNPVPTPARSSRVGSLEYRHTSAESLRDRGEKFDVVCAMEVVEHVDEPAQFMKCLGDMVKPGGHLILSTISRTPLSKLLTITLAEDVLRLVTPKTHTYSKYIQPGELVGFVNKKMGGVSVWERNELNTTKGQEVGEVRGIVYVPWRGEWVLWSDVEGTWTKGMGELCNYMFHAKKRKDAA